MRELDLNISKVTSVTLGITCAFFFFCFPPCYFFIVPDIFLWLGDTTDKERNNGWNLI